TGAAAAAHADRALAAAARDAKAASAAADAAAPGAETASASADASAPRQQASAQGRALQAELRHRHHRGSWLRSFGVGAAGIPVPLNASRLPLERKDTSAVGSKRWKPRPARA